MKREGQQRLEIAPCELEEANKFVENLHRHSNPVVGHRFSICVYDESDRVRGVAIVGRTIARRLQNRWTIEILRVCTDGCPNSCSILYSSCYKIGTAMGYKRFITYTKSDESGISLKAIGWKIKEFIKGRSWNVPSRPREDKHEISDRYRWEPDGGSAYFKDLVWPDFVEEKRPSMFDGIEV
jgi:hypothetical protein